jgi:hypothetical protein
MSTLPTKTDLNLTAVRALRRVPAKSQPESIGNKYARQVAVLPRVIVAEPAAELDDEGCPDCSLTILRKVALRDAGQGPNILVVPGAEGGKLVCPGIRLGTS